MFVKNVVWVLHTQTLFSWLRLVQWSSCS